jgi:carbamoyl-phosphate synthase large subunit
MPTLLFLSGGCRVGQNVLATLAGRRAGLGLVATSSIPDEPALFDFDAAYLVPPTAADPDAFERRVLSIVEGERIDLVVPCRDDDVVFLGGLRDRRPDLAPRLLCGTGATAEIVSDKWVASRFCAEQGLPFADSIVAGDAHARARFLASDGLPGVAKPRRGFSSGGIRLVWNEAQLDRALGRGDVVQRFIGDARVIDDFRRTLADDGIPLHYTFQTFKHSIQALVAPDGSVAHVICTRNQLNLRRAKRVEPDRDPASRDLGERCARAFASAGWRGPLNIQCQREPGGRLVIHEFNGRFTGATAVRWHLGFDEVGPAIERFAGPWPGRGERAVAARVALEGLASRAADPDHVDALARDGVWRR